MEEPPISDYALIGDTRTAALCSSHGSIDWLCLPRFDSEPVFGSLVARDTAGSFLIAPEGIRKVSRRYRDGSAVLETTWHPLQRTDRVADGTLLWRSTVSGVIEIRLWILSWGDDVEVIEPAELRDQVHAILERAAARYTR